MRQQSGGRVLNVTSLFGFLPAPFMGVHAASEHAFEGYSETLDHEVRGFLVRVVLVQPGFTRTHIGDNSQTPKLTLSEYAATRKRVTSVIESELVRGADPTAVTAGSPSPRYLVGLQNRILGVLRRHIPKAFSAPPFENSSGSMVCPIVVGRRAMDLKLVSREDFFAFYAKYTSQERKKKELASGGGDFYRTQNNRVGEMFARQVIYAALDGRVSFKEAYSLTGLSGGSFQEYAERLGVKLP